MIKKLSSRYVGFHKIMTKIKVIVDNRTGEEDTSTEKSDRYYVL